MWGNLSDAQRNTWLALMQGTLSAEGYNRVLAEWNADDVLAAAQGSDRLGGGPGGASCYSASIVTEAAKLSCTAPKAPITEKDWDILATFLTAGRRLNPSSTELRGLLEWRPPDSSYGPVTRRTGSRNSRYPLGSNYKLRASWWEALMLRWVTGGGGIHQALPGIGRDRRAAPAAHHARVEPAPLHCGPARPEQAAPVLGLEVLAERLVRRSGEGLVASHAEVLPSRVLGAAVATGHGVRRHVHPPP